MILTLIAIASDLSGARDSGLDFSGAFPPGGRLLSEQAKEDRGVTRDRWQEQAGMANCGRDSWESSICCDTCLSSRTVALNILVSRVGRAQVGSCWPHI
jgi:hypothetical protein